MLSSLGRLARAQAQIRVLVGHQKKERPARRIDRPAPALEFGPARRGAQAAAVRGLGEGQAAGLARGANGDRRGFVEPPVEKVGHAAMIRKTYGPETARF